MPADGRLEEELLVQEAKYPTSLIHPAQCFTFSPFSSSVPPGNHGNPCFLFFFALQQQRFHFPSAELSLYSSTTSSFCPFYLWSVLSAESVLLSLFARSHPIIPASFSFPHGPVILTRGLVSAPVKTRHQLVCHTHAALDKLNAEAAMRQKHQIYVD